MFPATSRRPAARLLALVAISALAAACGREAPAAQEAGGSRRADATGNGPSFSASVTFEQDVAGNVPGVTYHESDAEGHDREPEGLHNYRRWDDRIGQGAQPQGDVAFKNLAALGYKTVLSVDGARPAIELAEKHGLGYVHVPIGYDGVTREQAASISAAVERSDGPIYVHCHHGRHRGPAGVMAARRLLDGLGAEQAVADMKASRCSEKYTGLYRDVSQMKPLTAEERAAVPAELPSYVEPGTMVDAMVSVDERFANLKDSRSQGWAVPKDSPDVSPPHEARMLWEGYRELARTDESKAYGEEFLAMLKASEEAAIRLEEALRAGDHDAANAAADEVKTGCNSCHKAFRD